MNSITQKSKKKSGSGIVLHTICAALLIVCVFTYTYFFQANLLEMIQYTWSDNQTHYNHLIGSISITLTALLISFIVTRIFRIAKVFIALAHFPSLLLVGLLTAVRVDEASNMTINIWAIIFVVIAFVVYVMFMIAAQELASFPDRHNRFTGTLGCNVVTFCAMVAIMFCLGNTNRTLHTRLAVEDYCQEGQYNKALEYGIPQYDGDISTTMLRAFALVKTGEIGDRLFQYNINPETADGLLPYQGHCRLLLDDPHIIWQAIGFVPRNQSEPAEKYLARELKRHNARKPAVDYLLCTYLLKGNLQDFVKLLPKYYDLKSDLPQHYMEALILYNNSISHGSDKRINDIVVSHPAKNTDYNDFLQTMRLHENQAIKSATLRDAYFGTYWYYYYKRNGKI